MSRNFGNTTTVNLTPLMRQYWDIKSLHRDKILLFRMGDFFEMFFEDAVTAAPILGITLTSRNKKSQDETPMCGVPHHSVAGPINKLLNSGLKVAICDQIEDPKIAKGIVKRAVTRVLSPGMVYDSDTLEATQAHYMASVSVSLLGKLACVDATTGDAFVVGSVEPDDIRRLFALLPIVEIVAFENSLNLEFLKSLGPPLSLVPVSPGTSIPQELLNLLAPPLEISTEISQSPTEHGDSEGGEEEDPALTLLRYIVASGGVNALKNIRAFEWRSLIGRMDLGATVLRHLEIFSNSRGENHGTLFSCINRTQTSPGARLLRQRISFPLTQIKDIESRLDEVEFWTKDLAQIKQIREALGRMGDLERRLGKVTQPQANGRDIRHLAESILAGLEVSKLAQKEMVSKGFSQETLARLAQKVLKFIVEEPPLSTKQGYLISKGVHQGLDELIELSTNSQTLLQKMELKEKEQTGISSLKIRYNNVFGYYIEVTHTHRDKVPPHYLRKQTLSNVERYCTDELIELERKVLSAQTKRFELEYEIFEDLRREALGLSLELLRLSQVAAELDVTTSSAWLALEKNYTRPQVGSDFLKLTNSRHPVVEQTVKQSFTPNSVKIDRGGCLLLTGPNMAGKSTLMRQVALIAILAQSGLFVPAEKAELPSFNHLFTRIGSSDQLAEGLSTFMVEMTETSEMLKKAGLRSLLILDEIGRGTSTFDGLSLAQSILEFILTDLGSMTLFATHYHELTTLEERFTKIKNAHMRVIEKSGQIQFLHTLTPGSAQKSYGIHVAKLAGIPRSVTERAEEILKKHEKTSPLVKNMGAKLESETREQLSFDIDSSFSHPILDDLRKLELMSMTPLQALQKIAEWQSHV